MKNSNNHHDTRIHGSNAESGMRWNLWLAVVTTGYYCLITASIASAFVTTPSFTRIAPFPVTPFGSFDTRLEAKSSRKKASSHTASRGFQSTPVTTTSTTSTAPAAVSSISWTGSSAWRQAALSYDRLRKEFAASTDASTNTMVTNTTLLEQCGCDVYVQSPLHSPTTFWFVGKVIWNPTLPVEIDVSDTSNATSASLAVVSTNVITTNSTVVDNTVATLPNPQAAFGAVLAQKRLILEYAMAELRPSALGGRYARTLTLWIAPADSEMAVVQNKIVLWPVKGSKQDVPAAFQLPRQGHMAWQVGYNPEIYVGDEKTQGGLRVQRDEQGRPIKPVFDVHEPVQL
jgi:hypothetical protein